MNFMWILVITALLMGMLVPVQTAANARMRTSVGAADIELTDEEYTALTAALNKIEIHGDRNGKDIAKLGTVPDNVDR